MEEWQVDGLVSSGSTWTVELWWSGDGAGHTLQRTFYADGRAPVCTYAHRWAALVSYEQGDVPVKWRVLRAWLPVLSGDLDEAGLWGVAVPGVEHEHDSGVVTWSGR